VAESFRGDYQMSLENCESKTRYKSEKKAIKTSRFLKRVNVFREDGVRAYFCAHCKYYHLTSQTRGGYN